MNRCDDHEHDLLRAARCGDEQALGRLLAPHWCGLKLFCGLMLGDADAAERAVTETARTARSEVEVIESPEIVRMWIHRIAVRVCAQEIGYQAPERTNGADNHE
jgi:DNA-directed RNA polymerase specialized sigma24 family protein